MRDLVSYAEKHNLANGEGNLDGDNAGEGGVSDVGVWGPSLSRFVGLRLNELGASGGAARTRRRRRRLTCSR